MVPSPQYIRLTTNGIDYPLGLAAHLKYFKLIAAMGLGIGFTEPAMNKKPRASAT
jgi:hypothetical protein